jgi:hypothetical protein
MAQPYFICILKFAVALGSYKLPLWIIIALWFILNFDVMSCQQPRLLISTILVTYITPVLDQLISNHLTPAFLKTSKTESYAKTLVWTWYFISNHLVLIRCKLIANSFDS